jgi:hypothetical protein
MPVSPYRHVSYLKTPELILRYEGQDNESDDPTDQVMVTAIVQQPHNLRCPTIWKNLVDIAFSTKIPFFRPGAQYFIDYDRMNFPVLFCEPELPALTWEAPSWLPNMAYMHSFKDESLFSLATSIGWTPSTQHYDDPHISSSLIHWQGYEAIHSDHFPRFHEECLELRKVLTFPNFVMPYKGIDWTGLEIPTIQEWNREFDWQMRIRYYRENPSFFLQNPF